MAETNSLSEREHFLTDACALASRNGEQRWYAVYTCARHEKRVSEQLERKAVETFLALYETVHRWKNGLARVQLPLFPGYVFVHIPLKERLKVLEIRSVVRLVGFNGVPAPLPDGEIEALRQRLVSGVRAEPYPYLRIGRRVRVNNGPLLGAEGILVRTRNKSRIVLSIDLIMRSIAAEVEASDVEPIP